MSLEADGYGPRRSVFGKDDGIPVQVAQGPFALYVHQRGRCVRRERTLRLEESEDIGLADG